MSFSDKDSDQGEHTKRLPTNYDQLSSRTSNARSWLNWATNVISHNLTTPS